MNKFFSVRRFRVVTILLLGTVLSLGVRAEDDRQGGEFGDASFAAYEGPQEWPTGEKAQVIKDYVLPIYIGLPTQKYTVLGRIYDKRRNGIDIITRAFAEGLFSEKDRQRDCAKQGEFRKGDAVLVTNDEKLIKAFNLNKEDLEKTTPLFDHKDKVTVVIKFQ